jgi:hypothetical protein
MGNAGSKERKDRDKWVNYDILEETPLEIMLNTVSTLTIIVI